MNVQAAIKELNKSLGPPKERAAFGTWPTYAWLVRGLVEKNHGVSDAVTHVLTQSGLPVTKRSFGSLRAAFYKIRLDEWPAAIAQKDAPEPEEGFE
jgi:hypothetical protein